MSQADDGHQHRRRQTRRRRRAASRPRSTRGAARAERERPRGARRQRVMPPSCSGAAVRQTISRPANTTSAGRCATTITVRPSREPRARRRARARSVPPSRLAVGSSSRSSGASRRNARASATRAALARRQPGARSPSCQPTAPSRARRARRGTVSPADVASAPGAAGRCRSRCRRTGAAVRDPGDPWSARRPGRARPGRPRRSARRRRTARRTPSITPAASTCRSRSARSPRRLARRDAQRHAVERRFRRPGYATRQLVDLELRAEAGTLACPRAARGRSSTSKTRRATAAPSAPAW